MQVSIKGNQVQLQVSTITIQPEEGNNLYSFHCVNCGNFHQQIGGKVGKIYPIYEPSEQVAIVSTCSKCRHKYTFQVYDGYDAKTLGVVLYADEPVSRFYCYKGKHKILEFNKRMAVTILDGIQHKPPFKAVCPDIYCNTMYFFADLL